MLGKSPTGKTGDPVCGIILPPSKSNHSSHPTGLMDLLFFTRCHSTVQNCIEELGAVIGYTDDFFAGQVRTTLHYTRCPNTCYLCRTKSWRLLYCTSFLLRVSFLSPMVQPIEKCVRASLRVHPSMNNPLGCGISRSSRSSRGRSRCNTPSTCLIYTEVSVYPNCSIVRRTRGRR